MVVLRHERAHCNKWPADHRGARVWPGPNTNGRR
jgi:hypothetical protein